MQEDLVLFLFGAEEKECPWFDHGVIAEIFTGFKRQAPAADPVFSQILPRYSQYIIRFFFTISCQAAL